VPELAVSKLTAELPGAKPTVRDEPVVTVSTEDRSEADDGAERCVGSTWSQPSGAVHPSDDGRGPWCESPREVLDLRAERSIVGSREGAGEDSEDQGTLRGQAGRGWRTRRKQEELRARARSEGEVVVSRDSTSALSSLLPVHA
jgi:hypothetical protein